MSVSPTPPPAEQPVCNHKDRRTAVLVVLALLVGLLAGREFFSVQLRTEATGPSQVRDVAADTTTGVREDAAPPVSSTPSTPFSVPEGDDPNGSLVYRAVTTEPDTGQDTPIVLLPRSASFETVPPDSGTDSKTTGGQDDDAASGAGQVAVPSVDGTAGADTTADETTQGTTQGGTDTGSDAGTSTGTTGETTADDTTQGGTDTGSDAGTSTGTTGETTADDTTQGGTDTGSDAGTSPGTTGETTADDTTQGGTDTGSDAGTSTGTTGETTTDDTTQGGTDTGSDAGTSTGTTGETTTDDTTQGGTDTGSDAGTSTGTTGETTTDDTTQGGTDTGSDAGTSTGTTGETTTDDTTQGTATGSTTGSGTEVTVPAGPTVSYHVGALPDANWRIVYGAGTFVAVDGNQQAHYSTDGTTWTATSTLATGTASAGIAYGNGVFVAAFHNRDTYTSADGVTWTKHYSVLQGSSWTQIAFSGGAFLLYGPDQLDQAVSADGVHWTTRRMPSLAGGCLMADDGTFLAMGGSWAASETTTAAGSTWTKLVTPPQSGMYTRDWQCAAGNGHYVAMGTSGAVVTSTDGSSWAKVSLPRTPEMITFSGDRFVAIGGPQLMTSTDGVSWTTEDVALESHASMKYAATGGGRLVVISNLTGDVLVVE